MVCPKCKSENVTTQIVTDMKLKTKHHSIIWWICIGWWWELFLWLFLTIPKILFKIFGHKKQKIATKNYTMAVCQNCGNSWNIQ